VRVEAHAVEPGATSAAVAAALVGRMATPPVGP